MEKIVLLFLAVASRVLACLCFAMPSAFTAMVAGYVYAGINSANIPMAILDSSVLVWFSSITVLSACAAVLMLVSPVEDFFSREYWIEYSDPT